MKEKEYSFVEQLTRARAAREILQGCMDPELARICGELADWSTNHCEDFECDPESD